MLILLVLLGVVGVLFAAAVVATQETDVLAEAPPDGPDVQLPPGRVVAEDLRDVRFSMVFRGYRMDEVDDVLARLETELRERDERITDLENALAEVVEPAVAEAEAQAAAGSVEEAVLASGAEPWRIEPDEEPPLPGQADPWAAPRPLQESASSAGERALDLAASYSLNLRHPGFPVAHPEVELEPQPEPETEPETEPEPELEPASAWTDVPPGEEPPIDEPATDAPGPPPYEKVPEHWQAPAPEESQEDSPEASDGEPLDESTEASVEAPDEKAAEEPAPLEPVTAFLSTSAEAVAVPAPQPQPDPTGDPLVKPQGHDVQPEPAAPEQRAAVPAPEPDPDPTGDALLEPGAPADEEPLPASVEPEQEPGTVTVPEPPPSARLDDALDFPEIRGAEDDTQT